jgi:hypothetical protein
VVKIPSGSPPRSATAPEAEPELRPATEQRERAASAQPAGPAGAASALPITSAAPITREVAASLQGERAEGDGGVSARIAQIGKSSAAAVKEQVDRFLADERVQTIGVGLHAATRGTVDVFADGADFLLSTVGDVGDGVGDAMIETGARLDRLADRGREKLQNAADDLRKRGQALQAEAEALLEKAGELDDKGRTEAQQMWASGQVLTAVATRLGELIHLDEAKAFCARGGSALFKVTSDIFELVAEVVHAGAKGLAAGITLCGQFFKWLVGKDTLRSTALTFFGGLRVNAISQKLNAGFGGGIYFPSFKEKDGKSPDSYCDAIAFDWGVSAASPVVGAGWNSRGGAGAGINLYFVSATFNDMTERVFIGVPGVWGVTLGRDKERGSEVNFGSSSGVAGGEKLGAYLSYGVSLHTPLLDPVNKYVTRPIAKVIVELGNAVLAAAKWTYRKVRRDGAKPPDVSGDDSAAPFKAAPGA